MVERTVPGFLPSVHGLAFANAFPPGPTIRLGPLDLRRLGIGDASAGLCGGMALTALDLWAADVAAPADGVPPATGSRRFRALVRRQVQSLDWLRVPVRYAWLGVWRPEQPRGLAVRLGREPVRVTSVAREWPRVRAEIDAGRPCLVELIRVRGASPAALVRNHQVLAWGYVEATPGLTRIRVYDPNHPGSDHVELVVTTEPDDRRSLRDRVHLTQTTGEPLHGFFRGPLARPAPVGAWR